MSAATVHRVAFNVGKNLRKIHIHLYQCSTSSPGVRDFIKKHYMELKKVNPAFPILICQCCKVQPKLRVCYAFGQEKSVSLNNLSNEQVATALVNVMNGKACSLKKT